MGNRKPHVVMMKEFEKEQCILTAVSESIIKTVDGSIKGYIDGVLLDMLFYFITKRTPPSKGMQLDPAYEQKLSSYGGYRPLIQSFAIGPIAEQGRNFAVMKGVNYGISSVMKKLRGKEDVQTSMVAGFGSGVMLSLVTGMRGSEVITVGVLFGLFTSGRFKVQEKIVQLVESDIRKEAARKTWCRF